MRVTTLIFDTNVLRSLVASPRSTWDVLLERSSADEAELIIPEIVWAELVTHHRERLADAFDAWRKASEELRDLSVGAPQWPEGAERTHAAAETAVNEFRQR